MNCNKAQEMISLYVDNKLSAQSVSELQKHFEECDKCKQDYIFLKNVKKVLADTPKKEPSANFTASVMNKIKSENVKKDNVVMFGSFFNSFTKKMVMAAGFLFIVASSTFFFMHGPSVNQQNNDNYASAGMEYYFGYNNYYDGDTDIDDDDYEEYISMFC